MPYVVTDRCIRCKYQDCVDVCPVDCFYEGVNMLVINPNECIDCGACEPSCPAEAIISDDEETYVDWVDWNKKYAALWPVIKKKGRVPEDADDWLQRSGKEEFFDATPGSQT